MYRIKEWICATVACISLAACGLPADGRVRPRALSNGPTATVASAPIGTCDDQATNSSICAPSRKEQRQAIANEVIRIRTDSQGR